MSGAADSQIYVNFPSDADVCPLGTAGGLITDVTTATVVGGVGARTCNQAGGGLNPGMVINAGDQVSVTIGGSFPNTYMLLPSSPGSYSLSVSTTSDINVAGSNAFSVTADQSVSNVVATNTGPTTAAGARTTFSVAFTTSSTGGMSGAADSQIYVNFPSDADVCPLGTAGGLITDVTTATVVGGVGARTCNQAGGGLNPGMVINAGDQVSVTIGGSFPNTYMLLPSSPGSYSLSVSTTSDINVAGSNAFSVTADQSVSISQISPNYDGAGASGVTYAVAFTTSATGGMSSSADSQIYVNFPPSANVCPLGTAGGTITDVTTATVVGGVGARTCNQAGGGLNPGMVINAGDQLRIDMTPITNPTTLGSNLTTVSTTSDIVPALGPYVVADSTTVAGTVLDANGNPTSGAPVQICPSAGGLCQLGTSGADGSFTVIGLVTGPFAAVAFPPPGAPGPASVPVTISVAAPTPIAGVTLKLPATAVMPANAQITTPSGTTTGGVPVVNWGDPTTYQISGQCTGGYGLLFIHAVNTSTGQAEVVAVPMSETSPGTYVANIAPLAPLHGVATVEQSIACPGHTSILPDGGPSAGGTSSLLVGTGFTGATAVNFGSLAAASFKVLANDQIEAVSPPGTGSVLVTVKTASGSTVSVGGFSYFDVTGVSPGAGPYTGGTVVTIKGDGFTNVRGVRFGLLPSTTFTVVSSTELQATAPPGVGTVDIQVVDGFAVSEAVSADFFIYQGGPPGTSGISEGTGPGAVANLANQLNQNQVQANCAEIDYSLCYEPGDTIDLFDQNLVDIARDAAGDEIGCFVLGEAVDFLSLDPFLGISVDLVCDWGLSAYRLWNLRIDPSGTVLDTDGNPVKGATVSLLGQSTPGGPFVLVPPSSGAIEPPTNPETTDMTGEFQWDALAGTYEVTADKSGCQSVTTPPFAIPPPADGLVAVMQCVSTPPLPHVTNVSPNAGPAGGGSVVDIEGRGLGRATGVHFGTIAAASFTVLSPYAIAATAPPGSGTVDVTVTGAGGTSTTSSSDRYQYLSAPSSPNAPAVSALSPSSGPIWGGATVKITGARFTGVTSVTFGSAAASQFTVLSATEIDAVAPANAFVGPVNVLVDGPQGISSVVTADLYSYTAATSPGAPTGVTAVAGSKSALVSWTAPSDGGSPITSYTVVSRPGNHTARVGGGSTSTVVIGLKNGTAYTFTVTASTAAGSAKSAPSSNATPGVSTTLPGTPRSVIATAGVASATVAWKAPRSAGGAPILSYFVTSNPGGVTVVVAGDALAVTVSGLSSGTKYTFKVTALNAYGTGPASAASDSVTPSVPAALTSQNATPVSPNELLQRSWYERLRVELP
jgi:hypothetical protein